jgi:hypothetical protein
LVQLLATSEDPSTRRRAAESLGKIAVGNERAIAALVQLLATSEDPSTRRRAAESLGAIVTTTEQQKRVVSALSSHLSHETYNHHFDRFEDIYTVVWNITRDLPYTEFYHAWHGFSTLLSDRDIKDRLSRLPQILAQACNIPHLCIDGSRFSKPTNPAPQIYTALKKAGYPVSPDGKPRTLNDLQAYCEDDLDDHPTRVALILYENPTDPPPQGFDREVLNTLARFSYPAIAVVVAEPFPDCTLRQFLETDPDLVAQLCQWLEQLPDSLSESVETD